MTTARQVGAIETLSKQLSEADVALFVLVTNDTPTYSEEPPSPVRQQRQAAPMSVLSALLTSVAARHAERPEIARFVSQTVQFFEPAFTDDTVTAIAEVIAVDTVGHTLVTHVRCENQEGRRLAEGEIALRQD